jgi:hypothetical protein
MFGEGVDVGSSYSLSPLHFKAVSGLLLTPGALPPEIKSLLSFDTELCGSRMPSGYFREEKDLLFF